MTGGRRIYFKKFLVKFTFEILPAALVSAIGGFLLSQYRASPPPTSTVLVEAAPVAEVKEVMQLVREEHNLIVKFLKQEQAAKDDLAAAQARAFAAERKKAAEVKLAETKAAQARLADARDMARPPAKLAVKEPTRAKSLPQAQAGMPLDIPLDIRPIVTVESGPLATKPRGVIDSVTAKAGALRDQALATAEGIKDWLLSAGDKLLGGDSGVTSGPLTRLTSARW